MRAILTYHSIDPSGSPISVDEASFRRHVAWLASGAARVVPLDQIASLPSNESAVAITFDDGIRNIGEIAAPLLGDHALPATMFVVTGAVGSTNTWGGRADPRIPLLPLLDWGGIARLGECGITLGAHTRTHPRLSRLSAAEIEDEVLGSRDRIQSETGYLPRAFAYPYGDAADRALPVVAGHFRWACTTELRPLGTADDPHRLPRLDMHYLRAPGRLESWGSTRLRLMLRMRGRARDVRQRLAARSG